MRGMEGDGGESCSEPGERRGGERLGGGTVLKRKTSQCLRILEVGRGFRNLLIWPSPHHLPPLRKLVTKG